jgi:hypothetical protein
MFIFFQPPNLLREIKSLAFLILFLQKYLAHNQIIYLYIKNIIIAAITAIAARTHNIHLRSLVTTFNPRKKNIVPMAILTIG